MPKKDAQYDCGSASRSGAFCELIVAADMIHHGFEVFRAVQPHCTCDLIAMHRDGTLYRVEVRKGHRNGKGEPVPLKFDKTKHDVLVIVMRNELVYTPPLVSGEFQPVYTVVMKRRFSNA